MDGGNFWQKLFDTSKTLTLDGVYVDANNQTLVYSTTSAQPADSQGRNRADTDLEINDNDHQTLNYLEANDDNHQALDSLPAAQPAGSSDFPPNEATTNLEMNVNNHQTFDYLSAQQGNFQTPKRTYRKRKFPEGSSYQTSEKKRMADKAYRERRKEETDNTKAENDRLKTEIDRLNEECVGKNEALKTQEEDNKHLQKKVRRFEDSLRTQTTVVEALTKQLTASQIIDLQRENTFLKYIMDQSRKSANNQENSMICQLQGKNEQLEREKIALEKIVEALCLKINDIDKDHEEEHTQ